jgi:hypothetical protein
VSTTASAPNQPYQCPRCTTEVDIAARRCPNPECHADLGFCSYCRRIAAFPTDGLGQRRCSRCEGAVEPCLLRSLGANCNGYARREGVGRVICDRCRDRASVVVRWGAGIFAASVVASLLRPRKPQ